MALPLPAPTSTQSPETDPSRLAPHRIKRCTYRRLISLDRARERIYEVECLYPDRKVPIPLGDLRFRDGEGGVMGGVGWAIADLQRLRRGPHLPPGRGLTAADDAGASRARIRGMCQRGGL